MLHVFMTSNLKAVFATEPSHVSLIEAAKTGAETLKLKFELTSQNLIGEPFTIHFIPSESVDERYFKSVNAQTSCTTELFYVPQPGIAISKIARMLGFAVSILCWLTAAIGIVAKRFGSVEVLAVGQFLWVTLLWTDSVLYMPFKEFTTAKFTSGYNMPFFSQPPLLVPSSAPSSFPHFPYPPSFEAPHRAIFAMSSQIIDNFNVMFAFQIIPMFVFAIIFPFKRRWERKLKIIEETKKKRIDLLETVN